MSPTDSINKTNDSLWIFHGMPQAEGAVDAFSSNAEMTKIKHKNLKQKRLDIFLTNDRLSPQWTSHELIFNELSAFPM